jgi:parvulin-like peptidyl-prolyl isomerase
VARLLRLPLLVALAAVPAGAAAGACNDAALRNDAQASAVPAPSGLGPELASKVLARVGDREITLGEYAAVIDRMDPFEKLRYQPEERRLALLDEMIKVELLAREAERRGLDKKPETKERIRQVLRDTLLREVRESLPAPATIPEAEVRAYYDAHRAEFREPERRRVAHIVLGDEAKAKRVLELARKATPTEWGRLVMEHSLDKPAKPVATAALELAGDLGIVEPPGSGEPNPKVPEPVRKAVFEIGEVGGVFGSLVAADGKLHVVRMAGKTAARDRSFAEAERTIRVSILQDKLKNAEDELEARLRKKYQVRVDDVALAKVKVPDLGSSSGAPPP